MKRLEGKVALITGAARGLGAAHAMAMAQHGAQVAVCDLADAEGQQLTADICAADADALYFHLDVAREEDWLEVVRKTVEHYGKLDVLVNNAGIVIPRVPIEQRSVAEWDQVMAVNVRGVFLGTKHVIPEMRRAGGGSIVNISSLAGIGQSQIQEPAYATSKAAVRMFSKVTAAQHAHEKIRCNSLHPGPTDGGMLHRFLPDSEALAKRLQRVPMGRLARVEEIVAGVIFLASDESSYMTGSELVIDGGALAQ
jgi:cyclopentanol dehydrogenase